jgi:hypothetical protein
MNLLEFRNFLDFQRFAAACVFLKLLRPSDLAVLEVSIPSTIDAKLYCEYFAELSRHPYSSDLDRMLCFVEGERHPIPMDSCHTVSTLE